MKVVQYFKTGVVHTLYGNNELLVLLLGTFAIVGTTIWVISTE
jgi:hypothetical protein